MSHRFRAAIAGAAAAAILTCAHYAGAQSIGTISACYYSAECTYSQTKVLTGAVDGPAFQFTNTGTQPIKNARFAIVKNKKLSIVADSYKIGLIKPGASVAIIVGASNDGKTHPAGGFFTFLSPTDPLDTSDDGPDADAVRFSFTGKIGTQKVTSGTIVAGATAGPSVDGTVAKINFLGGPGNDDGPCGDCFGSKTIATLSVAP
jgi:hypothetical protein